LGNGAALPLLSPRWRSDERLNVFRHLSNKFLFFNNSARVREKLLRRTVCGAEMNESNRTDAMAKGGLRTE
jgi:hypothetical protein